MKRTLDLSSGLWARVDRMSKQVSRTVPEFVENCIKRRLRRLENRHSTRIYLEGEFNTGKKKKATKKKVVAKKRTVAKKKVAAKKPAPVAAVA